jgi:hypothetical protein
MTLFSDGIFCHSHASDQRGVAVVLRGHAHALSAASGRPLGPQYGTGDFRQPIEVRSLLINTYNVTDGLCLFRDSAVPSFDQLLYFVGQLWKHKTYLLRESLSLLLPVAAFAVFVVKNGGIVLGNQLFNFVWYLDHI